MAVVVVVSVVASVVLDVSYWFRNSTKLFHMTYRLACNQNRVRGAGFIAVPSSTPLETVKIGSITAIAVSSACSDPQQQISTLKQRTNEHIYGAECGLICWICRLGVLFIYCRDSS